MISREEILNLATLARLKLTDAEVTGLQKDISNILEYVGQVSNRGDALTPGLSKASPLALRNVMRKDEPAPVLGAREDLLGAFPKREGDYNVVRKIVQKDE